MIFAAVNENPGERRKLTALLLSLYPGGIIYEFSDPLEVLACLRTHRLDAVFLEPNLQNGQTLHLLSRIRSQNASVPVLICAEDDSLLEEAMWNGASEYFIKPLLPHQIQAALGIGQ